MCTEVIVQRQCRFLRHSVVFGLVDLACDDFFQLHMSSGTRGHAFKLYKPCVNSFFSRICFLVNRVINIWNSLPQSTNFCSLNAF